MQNVILTTRDSWTLALEPQGSNINTTEKASKKIALKVLLLFCFCFCFFPKERRNWFVLAHVRPREPSLLEGNTVLQRCACTQKLLPGLVLAVEPRGHAWPEVLSAEPEERCKEDRRWPHPTGTSSGIASLTCWKRGAIVLPLVECLPPAVTKNFGQTFQCEGAEEGFLMWGPSSALASQCGERSPSEPPETQPSPLQAVHAVTETQTRSFLGISQWPDVESKHQVKTELSVQNGKKGNQKKI